MYSGRITEDITLLRKRVGEMLRNFKIHEGLEVFHLQYNSGNGSFALIFIYLFYLMNLLASIQS